MGELLIRQAQVLLMGKGRVTETGLMPRLLVGRLRRPVEVSGRKVSGFTDRTCELGLNRGSGQFEWIKLPSKGIHL